MKWSPDFATGFERIDAHHKMLFRMAADYRTALDEGAGERVYVQLLDALDVYARAHFRYEERCMEERGCPVAAKNRDAHRRFLEVLQEYRGRFEREGFHPDDAENLVDLVDDWLANHICKIDLRLREYADRPEESPGTEPRDGGA